MRSFSFPRVSSWQELIQRSHWPSRSDGMHLRSPPSDAPSKLFECTGADRGRPREAKRTHPNTSMAVGHFEALTMSPLLYLCIVCRVYSPGRRASSRGVACWLDYLSLCDSRGRLVVGHSSELLLLCQGGLYGCMVWRLDDDLAYRFNDGVLWKKKWWFNSKKIHIGVVQKIHVSIMIQLGNGSSGKFA